MAKSLVLIDGQKLTQIRIKANKSLEDVAQYVGVNRSTVSRWERGTTPSLDALGRLKAFFGTDKFLAQEIWNSAKFGDGRYLVSSMGRAAMIFKKVRPHHLEKRFTNDH